MQAEGNVFERVTQAYQASRGVRLLCVLAVVLSAPLLFVLAGGFPPYAWRLLVQALPQMPALLQVHGPGTLLAVLGVLLLSVTIFVSWCALLWLGWKMFAYWRYERQELRRFATDVEVARYQNEEMSEQYAEDGSVAEEEWEDRRTRPTGGQSYPPVARRRVIYPLAPLTPPLPEDEYAEQDEAYSEEDEFFDDEEGEESVMSLYRDEEDEEDEEAMNWSGQRSASAFSASTPAQPALPLPVYDQQIVEHAAPVPVAEQADNIQYSSYGRVLPFSAAPSVGLLPHLTAAPYNRVPFQTPEPSGPLGQQVTPSQALPARVAPTQPAAYLAPSQPLQQPVEPAQPAAQRVEPSPLGQAVTLLPHSMPVQAVGVPQSVQPVQGARPTTQLPPAASMKSVFPSQKIVPARPVSPAPRTAPVPAVTRLVAPPPAQPAGSGLAQPTTRQTIPAQSAIPAQPAPSKESAPPKQQSAMQSLVELISTVPLPPRAKILASIAGRQPAKVEPEGRVPTTQLVVSTGLDVGLKRRGKPNEDSLLALQNTRVLRGGECPVGLFVVADGMGGHDNGQEASHLVIQSLSKTVVPALIYGPTDDNYSELLAEGVHHANLEVYQRNRQTKADMGTTVVAALVVDTTAHIVSAGDSRVYLYRAASGLTQVTRDHSTVARLVESGLLKAEDVYTHPRRNEIYRSLGHHPSEDLDKFILALQPDDVLLLCSDGLWEMVRDAHIREIIASTAGQPAQTSAALVQAALDGGGKDNISVIVVYVKAATDARTAWAG